MSPFDEYYSSKHSKAGKRRLYKPATVVGGNPGKQVKALPKSSHAAIKTEGSDVRLSKQLRTSSNDTNVYMKTQEDAALTPRLKFIKNKRGNSSEDGQRAQKTVAQALKNSLKLPLNLHHIKSLSTYELNKGGAASQKSTSRLFTS